MEALGLRPQKLWPGNTEMLNEIVEKEYTCIILDYKQKKFLFLKS